MEQCGGMMTERRKPGRPPLDLWVKLVNCAGCRAVLLGESMRRYVKSGACTLGQYAIYEPVEMRIGGRPYCAVCVQRGGW